LDVGFMVRISSVLEEVAAFVEQLERSEKVLLAFPCIFNSGDACSGWYSYIFSLLKAGLLQFEVDDARLCPLASALLLLVELGVGKGGEGFLLNGKTDRIFYLLRNVGVVLVMLLLLRLRSGLLLSAVEVLVEDAVLLLLGQTRLLPQSLAEVHDGLLRLFFLRVWLVLVECLLGLLLELPGAGLDDWHLLAGSRLFLIEIVEEG
jgi:hypothetical protein